MKRKEILAAGIIQDLLFHNDHDLQIYLASLDGKFIPYKVLEDLRREDGSVIIRIVKQYNNSALIQFPEVQ